MSCQLWSSLLVGLPRICVIRHLHIEARWAAKYYLVFLRATACNSYRWFRLSVRLTHSGTVSQRRKLGSL